jgi:hypothetical protein
MDDYGSTKNLFIVEFSFVTYHHNCNVDFVDTTYLLFMDIYVDLLPPYFCS